MPCTLDATTGTGWSHGCSSQPDMDLERRPTRCMDVHEYLGHRQHIYNDRLQHVGGYSTGDLVERQQR